MVRKCGYGAADDGRTPEKQQEQHGRTALDQRRILLLPLLLAVGLLAVSSAFSKFLAPHAEAEKPGDEDIRCVRGFATKVCGISFF